MIALRWETPTATHTDGAIENDMISELHIRNGRNEDEIIISLERNSLDCEEVD